MKLTEQERERVKLVVEKMEAAEKCPRTCHRFMFNPTSICHEDGKITDSLYLHLFPELTFDSWQDSCPCDIYDFEDILRIAKDALKAG